MFTGFIYRHIQIGVSYVDKPFYELLSEKNSIIVFHFSKLLLFFCYEIYIGKFCHLARPLAGYGLPPPGGILYTIFFLKLNVLQGIATC